MRENVLADDVDQAPRILRLLASRLRLSGGPDATELFRGLLDDAIVLEGGRAMSGDEPRAVDPLRPRNDAGALGRAGDRVHTHGEGARRRAIRSRHARPTMQGQTRRVAVA
jgi:hypothetical protein